jgi:solute carrier family 25 (mitochondrial adenine nucleotide translocator), member 4/5/6/31
VFIFKGLYFGIFDTLKPSLKKHIGDYFASNFVLGFFSTTVANLFSYPFDTIRRRLLMNSYMENYKGIVDCVIKIHGREGLHSLYRGFGISTTGCLTGALTLALYERGKKMCFGTRELLNENM